jgi:predicted acyltransferase
LDVLGWRRWGKFFEIYGQNAITVFVLAGVFGRLFSMRLFGFDTSFKGWYYPTLFQSWLTDPYLASFAHSIAFMMFLFVIAWVMYKRNWIVKV